MAKHILSDRQLAGFKPPAEGRVELRDGGGLVVRLTASGVKTFGVWWRIPAKFGRSAKGFFTLGTYPAVKLEAARERAEEIAGLAKKGLHPVEEMQRREKAVRELTMLRMVERHLKAREAKLRPSTLEQYGQMIEILKDSPLAQRSLVELSRGEVREDLRAIARHRSSGTARKVRTLVRGAARWAAAEDLVPYDVLSGLNFTEVEPRVRDRVLTDEEILVLWRACDDAPPLDAAGVRLQLVLALRHPSETTGMLWTDLSRSSLESFGEVVVYSMPGERRKHGIPHALPLPPLAVEIIEALRPLTGQAQLVLEGWTRGRDLHWWRHRIRRKLLDAGSASFTRHDLRRTAASGMCRIGVPVHAADTVLGHRIKGSAASYIHGARLLEAAGALWRWSAHLEKLLGRRPTVLEFPLSRA